MTRPALATLRGLPDSALVPVGWVRELLDDADEPASGPGHTVEEAAVILKNRAPSTIRAWCAAGRLPGAYRLQGREWRIPAAALATLGAQGSPPAQETVERLPVPPGGLRAWRAS